MKKNLSLAFLAFYSIFLNSNLLAQKNFSSNTNDLLHSLEGHRDYFDSLELQKRPPQLRALPQGKFDINYNKAYWLLLTSKLVSSLQYRLDEQGAALSRDQSRVSFLRLIYKPDPIKRKPVIDINKKSIDNELVNYIIMACKKEARQNLKLKIQQRLNQDRNATWLKIETTFLDTAASRFTKEVIDFPYFRLMDDDTLGIGGILLQNHFIAQEDIERYDFDSRFITRTQKNQLAISEPIHQRYYEYLILQDIIQRLAQFHKVMGIKLENFPEFKKISIDHPKETLMSPYETMAYLIFKDLINSEALEPALRDLVAAYNVESIRKTH